MDTQFSYRIVENVSDLQKAFFVRGVVFVEEQNCPYREEHDQHDYSATHFIVTQGEEPVATARIRLCHDYVKIERLAVRRAFRKKAIGKQLFRFILTHIEKLGYQKTVLHAQAYLLRFYEEFGFVKKGDLFLEANIEHYHMERE